MNNLKTIENELVPVYVTDKGEKVVNGRELHKVLQSKQDFSTWVKVRLKECDAVENIDYDRFHKKMEANNATVIEYIIKLVTAKEIAMLERNKKGKEVRRYFIRIEEKYKSQQAPPLTLKERIQTIAQGTAELYERVEGVEGRIEELENTMNLDYGRQRRLEKAVNKTVIEVLGGKESNAYNIIGRKVFCECNGNLKDYFQVNARGDVPRKRYEEALSYAKNWKPCTNTLMQIEMLNAQQALSF